MAARMSMLSRSFRVRAAARPMKRPLVRAVAPRAIGGHRAQAPFPRARGRVVVRGWRARERARRTFTPPGHVEHRAERSGASRPGQGKGARGKRERGRKRAFRPGPSSARGKRSGEAGPGRGDGWVHCGSRGRRAARCAYVRPARGGSRTANHPQLIAHRQLLVWSSRVILPAHSICLLASFAAPGLVYRPAALHKARRADGPSL
jgi:hypothetical protein